MKIWELLGGYDEILLLIEGMVKFYYLRGIDEILEFLGYDPIFVFLGGIMRKFFLNSNSSP